MGDIQRLMRGAWARKRFQQVRWAMELVRARMQAYVVRRSFELMRSGFLRLQSKLMILHVQASNQAHTFAERQDVLNDSLVRNYEPTATDDPGARPSGAGGESKG